MLKHLLAIAFDWGIRSFGRDHMMNLPMRSLRIVEEAIELCQSYGVPIATVRLCVETVYSREIGEPDKEMSQVLLTAFELCAAKGQDPIDLFTTELRRVLAKPPKVMAQRNQEKVGLGLTVPSCADEPRSAPQSFIPRDR